MLALARRIDQSAPGVYLVTPTGGMYLVHDYRGGDYALAEIFDYFELGEVLTDDGAPGIELDDRELKKLAMMADRYRDDHPPEFAEMCLDIAHAIQLDKGDMATFYANF